MGENGASKQRSRTMCIIVATNQPPKKIPTMRYAIRVFSTPYAAMHPS